MKTWKIRSESNHDTIYTVSMITDYQWECTCPNYQFRHQACKHIKYIQKEIYDKQNTKHQPNGNRSQKAPIRSDNQKPTKRRDNLPKQELLGDSVNNGEPTKIPTGNNQREARNNNRSQPSKTSMGTPNTKPDLPRPSKEEPPTKTPGSDPICKEPSKKERLLREKATQIKIKDQWESRRTKNSAVHFDKLQELRKQYKEEKNGEKREIIALRAKPIKLAVKSANKKLYNEKNLYPENLININIEDLTEEEVEQYEMFFSA